MSAIGRADMRRGILVLICVLPSLTAAADPSSPADRVVTRRTRLAFFSPIKSVEAWCGGKRRTCLDEPVVLAGAEAGPFAEVRVLSVVPRRGDRRCALAVRVGKAWYVSEDADVTCTRGNDDDDDNHDYDDHNVWSERAGDRLLIFSSVGHDPCGCGDLWVGSKWMDVCGIDGDGRPACTKPIPFERTGADEITRTYSIAHDTLALSAWFYGTSGEIPPPAEREVELGETGTGIRGGPAEQYKLSF
jgi:hypothetical protein